jgi:hypothetical protein
VRNKILNFFSWFLGGTALIYGVLRLFSQPRESIYLLSLAFLIFPPLSNLITKSKHARNIKIIIGIIFFASVFAGPFLNENRVTEEDKYKRSNIGILKIIAKNYCVEKGKCPDSLDQLFSEGYTGPFESFKHEDYFYRQIDGGEDCVISTTTSNGERITRLCIGENLEYIKYLQNPER